MIIKNNSTAEIYTTLRTNTMYQTLTIITHMQHVVGNEIRLKCKSHAKHSRFSYLNFPAKFGRLPKEYKVSPLDKLILVFSATCRDTYHYATEDCLVHHVFDLSQLTTSINSYTAYLISQVILIGKSSIVKCIR